MAKSIYYSSNSALSWKKTVPSWYRLAVRQRTDNFYTRRLRPEVKRLNLSLPHILFLTEKVPLSYTQFSTDKWYPFHIASLGRYIALNCCKCTVLKGTDSRFSACSFIKMLFFCRDMLYRLCKQYDHVILLSKNQSTLSPGSHLHLINLSICKYFKLINHGIKQSGQQ